MIIGMDNAEKILARMRQTKHGWKPRDFKRLYTGFGFVLEESTKHTTYIHDEYGIITQVARHRKLAPSYADDAVRFVDQVKARIQQAQDDNPDDI